MRFTIGQRVGRPPALLKGLRSMLGYGVRAVQQVTCRWAPGMPVASVRIALVRIASIVARDTSLCDASVPRGGVVRTRTCGAA